ncbi:MAG TPA: Cys-tRNA(Pro) deacylase [Clostridiales bacterium]|nr:Cys-tRNA(Pro) deacylase [Clostridiales bacterium]
MAKEKLEKTNAMRILDQKKVAYKEHILGITEAVSGVEAATLLGVDENLVFKTLVTVGKSLEHYVFVVPVASELDLKKAAACVNEKSVEMVKSKDLLPLTGYVHGGCSPVGMKKFFKTTFDESAQNVDRIFFSGGRIGFQIETTLSELKKAITFQVKDITVKQ